MKSTFIACLCLGSFAQALEVHEWGTFTVLSGSNGAAVPWYAFQNDTARLPDFIAPGIGGKGGAASVRMETPVIYFYPEKETKVTVDVSFANGSITETFPHSVGGRISIDPTSGLMMEGKWTGTLHRPSDMKALAAIPAISNAANAEPYGAAREVPDAWIFESDLKEIPGLKVQPKFPQLEKFIFYRGAGHAYIPISATMEGDSATLTSQSDGVVRFGTALRVRDGKAAWVPIPPFAGGEAANSSIPNRAHIQFPAPDRALDQVESELAEAWKKALAADGLTPAEASAMVETWRKTWFRESGDRILTLVPRKTIDHLLPLKITPAPKKTERVFVARIEMISPDREQALVALLNSSTEPGETELAEFEKLALGRFASGAMEVAVGIHTGKMRQKFFGFGQFAESRKTSRR